MIDAKSLVAGAVWSLQLLHVYWWYQRQEISIAKNNLEGLRIAETAFMVLGILFLIYTGGILALIH